MNNDKYEIKKKENLKNEKSIIIVFGIIPNPADNTKVAIEPKLYFNADIVLNNTLLKKSIKIANKIAYKLNGTNYTKIKQLKSNLAIINIKNIVNCLHTIPYDKTQTYYGMEKWL